MTYTNVVYMLSIVNPNMLKINLSTLDKDMELLTHRHPDYGRIKSLVLNIKCSYAQK